MESIFHFLSGHYWKILKTLKEYFNCFNPCWTNAERPASGQPNVTKILLQQSHLHMVCGDFHVTKAELNS